MSIGDRIKLARTAARLPQRKLADRVGLSAQAISFYERGERTPDTGVLVRLAKALGVRVEYFFREPRRIDQIAFRKLSCVGARQTLAVEARVRDWLERYYAIEEILGVASDPAMPSPCPASTPDEAEEAAQSLRDQWDLGEGPVPDLIALLEDKGLRVGVLDPAPKGFDACVVWADDAVGIMVRGGLPGDRQRFNLAHELGHIVFGAASVSDDKLAHRFAGAFLVPAEAARRELGDQRKRLDLLELHLLKHKYGLSMRGWVMRAAELGIISAEYAGQLHREFTKKGWRTKEPGDPLPSEHPTRMERLILRAHADGMISESRAGELLGKPLPVYVADEAHEHGEMPVGLGSG